MKKPLGSLNQDDFLFTSLDTFSCGIQEVKSCHGSRIFIVDPLFISEIKIVHDRIIFPPKSGDFIYRHPQIIYHVFRFLRACQFL